MKKHNILVVDDDKLNVKLLSAMLPEDRYDKTVAFGGAEALEIINKNKPDLVLLDVMMPDVDGFEVTEQVKNNSDTCDIPIVLITAIDGIENKIKGLEYGADEFINKPINAQELLARVESLIKLKKYQDQLKSAGEKRPSNPGQRYKKKPDRKLTDLPKILIVDDDEKDIKLLKSFLHEASYKLMIANTGEDAISRATGEEIDIIFLDLLLPGLDGFKVCKILKESEITKNIQIVVVTNLMDLESKLKGIHLGADDFLVKPVNRYELQLRTKSLVKKKRYIDRLCISLDQMDVV